MTTLVFFSNLYKMVCESVILHPVSKFGATWPDNSIRNPSVLETVVGTAPKAVTSSIIAAA